MYTNSSLIIQSNGAIFSLSTFQFVINMIAMNGVKCWFSLLI